MGASRQDMGIKIVKMCLKTCMGIHESYGGIRDMYGAIGRVWMCMSGKKEECSVRFLYAWSERKNTEKYVEK